jgi:hypothetical protein
VVPVVATAGGTSSESGNTLVAPTARRDPGRCRPWPSYGRARLRSMRKRRPAVIWGSRAWTARRVPGHWCSGRVPAFVREAGRYRKIFVPPLRCAPGRGEPCVAACIHAGLAAECAETIGSVVGEMVAGGGAEPGGRTGWA